MGSEPAEAEERGTTDSENPPAPYTSARARLRRALHLAALSSFAVAEPLYSILRPSAAFFVVRRSEPVDLWVLVLLLGLALPLALWIVCEALALVRVGLGRLAYGATVFVLFALIASAPLVRALPDSPGLVLPGAALVGGLGLVLYARLEPARAFLSLLSPAPIAFAALFLLHPSIARLRGVGGEAPLLDHGVEDAPSVVMVVLDELPITSLMADEGSIDANLFPAFARLAREGTWFRNATTNHESTVYALPTILSGKLPTDRGKLPTLADHPENLFTMLGLSHRMKVWETFTSLCPDSLAGTRRPDPDPLAARIRSLVADLSVVYAHVVLPETLTRALPSVTSNWSGFAAGAAAPRADGDGVGAGAGASPRGTPAGPEADDVLEAKKAAARVGRTEKFREFTAAVDGDPAPTLYFLHLLTPHGPWNHLRSGKRYNEALLPRSYAAGVWPETDNYGAFAFQRHLLHLGHVDRLLGELLDALDAQGVYDRSLVMLVADHGISFAPGEYGRQTFRGSVRKIAHVPLFVKRPFEPEPGTVTDRNVETIDLVPTVADVLGIELPWELDGMSVFSSQPARPGKLVYRREEPLELQGAPSARWPELQHKRRLFGEPENWTGMFAVGGGAEWLGRRLTDLDVAAPAGRYELDGPQRFLAVEQAVTRRPCFVTGEITREVSGQPIPERVVVALNGVVTATGYTFEPDAKRGTALFAAMIPPAALRPGRNSVQLLGVGAGEELVPMQALER